MLHAITVARHPHFRWFRHWHGLVCMVCFVLLSSGVHGQDGDTAEEDSEPQEEVTTSARYVDLQPEFVLNYGDTDRLRFARLEVTIVGESLEAAADINHHSPALRHIVIMTLTRADQDEIASTAGRQALRDELRQEMRTFFQEEADAPLVSEVLFSNFIVN